MYGKAVGGNWMKVKRKNSLAVKFIFIKSDKSRLFMVAPYLGIELSKKNRTEGRIVFKLQYRHTCRDIRTDKVGWSKEMKITELE